MENNKKALVLFSGGLDSATALMIARSEGFHCTTLTINYHQRHLHEIEASKSFLEDYPDIDSKIFDFDLSVIGGSALTDKKILVPNTPTDGIPITYVPARNTIFLSIASSFAEILQIYNIFLGVNQIDYSGYPDCRPEYIRAFEEMINLGTKTGVEGEKIKLHTPLINMSKVEIIKKGKKLNIDYSKTLSCYSPNKKGQACGVCDACRFRKQGFLDANIEDPTQYKKIEKL
ncbi:MAG: 7-cyano-7-deazaguanine synthase QueC [Pseudomonadota bacterium]|nr:7-cyano-7-deazaguanine synthase QueC [Pseudomonadota bacterium]